MIFTQGAQGAQRASERAAIIGQSLREGEYQVQRIIEQGWHGKGWIFLVMHTTLMIPLALKQLPADQPLAENALTQLNALLYAEDSTAPTITPLHQAQEGIFPAPDGSATNQFMREALLLARLRHTAIPTLYDYFFEDGYWYLVMDYIPGHTLTTYLQQYGHISALEALNCTIQICDILDYLHTQTPAIILWNLTTDSIRVTPEGVLMLANFDFAQYAQSQVVEEDAADTKTANGHIHRPGDTEMEMIAYMPAQQNTRRNRDTLADVYSLGIILREMLYGKKAGQAGSEDAEASQRGIEARKDQSQQSSQDPHHHHAPHISTYLKSLVRLATRTEPMDRFQSTQTFSLALLRAYQIEEQRAFQEHLVQLNDQTRLTEQSEGELTDGEQKEVERATRGDESSGAYGQDKKGWEREDTPPITLSRTLELEQRQLTRAALQRVRQERQQHEQVEIQLTSVDEGLEQRSNVSHKQISPQTIAHAEAPTVTISFTRRLQGIIRVNFVLALILCIVLVSLLIYVRIAQPLENSIHSLMQGPISSTNGSGDLQNSQSTPNTQNTQGMQKQQGINGGLADNYWQALPSLPGAEADNAIVYVEMQGRAYIYMSGGYHGSPPTAYDRSLYRYDIRAAHWETVSSDHLPGMVNNAADVDEQGHIFFTAGYSSDTYTVSSQLYVYDPGTSFLKRITAPEQMPVGFGGSIFADRQGHLYITQGFMHPGDPHAQAGTGWYRYDIGTTQWHQLATLPVGLGYTFTASDNNGAILLMGGATDAGQHNPTNKIYRYDIASDSWTQAIDNLPQAISGAAGCQAWPGQFVIVGGYDPAHDTGTKSTWLFDLHTLQWRSLMDLTIGGSVLGAAACDGKGHVFLERGTNNPRVPTGDYWEMVVAPGIKIDNA